ncbi:reprolysin-like metallopeptidase [Aquimarina sp. 2201CG1-2-11]|uniref:reprolysin-like metallopeptidase n=1 Tax=Aquimarina discodermiae TaxID=3231043 RepID=UPI003462AD75
MKTRLFMIVGLMVLHLSYAQDKNYWNQSPKKSQLEIIPNYNKLKTSNNNVYGLNIDGLRNALLAAPERSNLQHRSNNIISFPDRDGTMLDYEMKEIYILHPDLAKKYPSIKSYVGTQVVNRLNTIRISISDNEFHGMILKPDAPSVYIDPITTDRKTYVTYNKADITKNKEFRCLFDGNNNPLEKNNIDFKLGHQKNANDGTLRKYRIAIACTDEYSQFHLNNQEIPSGASDTAKKEAVLSAINTTMVRVSGIYERDLGVTFEIVPNNTDIIYLYPGTNNLNNNNADVLINQSQEVCDDVIGSANYDIGHTFSTGAGGLAGLGVVCSNNRKGEGVTGLSNPIGDPYYVDYVAHEIGHQFGANHTQNNPCNRVPTTSVEPGSASTIMGYAGICTPNVQNQSDDHFHAISIQEMWAHVTSTSCAETTSTTNVAPVANAGNNFTIPKSTPFILKGNATDANADELTYNWEQMDTEFATMPPSSASTVGPAFRSLPSSMSPDRYMPELITVVGGSTASTWEVIPSVARTMNFRLTVRDNQSGIGNTDSDDMVITVNGTAGPFLVTTPNTNVNWMSGTTQTINWDVAGTTANGVNAANVDILLSIDGGFTYPITLVLGTPNDGTHDIIVPNSPGTNNRIMIRGSEHIFYDISNADFQISSGGADDTEPPSDPTNLVGSNLTHATIDLSWNPSTDNVAINGYDVYQGNTVIATVPETTYLVTGLTPETEYSFRIRAKDVAGNESGFSNTVTVTTLEDINLDSQPPTIPGNLSASNPTSTTIDLSWFPSTDNIGVTGYDIYSGDDIIATATSSPYTVTGLTPETTYSFRVRAKDAIGNVSDFSNIATATTLPACIEVTLNLNVDQFPEEISWQITDGNNQIIVSNETVASSSSTTPTACLKPGTYTFTITDSFGDGLCCNYGEGSYTLTANPGNKELASGREFGTSETTTFTINDSIEGVVINESSSTTYSETIIISPNPLGGANSILNFDGPFSSLSVTVIDFSGRSVFKENNVQNKSIDLHALSSGTYFVKILSGTKTENQVNQSVYKLIIK